MKSLSAEPTGEHSLLAGRYVLERLLASGGMGDVWLARHVGLEREVAVKLLRDKHEQSAERLLLEARILARIKHPAIVEVFDCGSTEDGAPYIVMEMLNGDTLAKHLRVMGPQGAVAASQLLMPVLAGLAAVHRAGIVHRDLKPENIMLTSNAAGFAPKLIDFGIARQHSNLAPRFTERGTFVGTPQYMAPEQLLGAAGDVCSDVWALTAVLYETICGAAPFDGPDMERIFRAIAYEAPPFPAQVKDLDGKLWAILMRGLRKRPDERYGSCTELEDALASWLLHRSPSRVAPPSPALQTQSRALRPPTTKLDSVETPLDSLIRSKKETR